MDYYSSQISKLIEELSRLPGIGAKSAGRLAFHIINMPKEQVEQLAATLVDARNNVRYCKQCCTLTDKELCPICASEERDHKTICTDHADTVAQGPDPGRPFLRKWNISNRSGFDGS